MIYNSKISKKINIKKYNIGLIYYVKEQKKTTPFDILHYKPCTIKLIEQNIGINFPLLEYYIYKLLPIPSNMKKLDQEDWPYYPEYWLINEKNNNRIDFPVQIIQNYVDGIYLSKEDTERMFYKWNDIKIDEKKVDQENILQWLNNNYSFGEKSNFIEQYQENIGVEEIKL